MDDKQILISIQEDLQKLLNSFSNHSVPASQKEYFTSEEAADYLGIKISYLYKLVHQGVITPYKPFGKLLYFKPEQLRAFIESGKIKSREEIEREAELYLLKSKHK